MDNVDRIKDCLLRSSDIRECPPYPYFSIDTMVVVFSEAVKQRIKERGLGFIPDVAILFEASKSDTSIQNDGSHIFYSFEEGVLKPIPFEGADFEGHKFLRDGRGNIGKMKHWIPLDSPLLCIS